MKAKNNSIFAEKLKQLRLATRMSQTALALVLNISRSCLANYESGRRFPDPEMLDMIAKHFHVKTDYFLTENSFVLSNSQNSGDNSKILKEIASSGTLDISNMSPASKAMLFEYCNYLIEMQNLTKEAQNR